MWTNVFQCLHFQWQYFIKCRRSVLLYLCDCGLEWAVSVVWSDQRWDLNTLYQWLTLKTGESFFFPLTRPESQKYVRISHLNNELEIDTTLIGSHEQRPIPHSSNSFLTQSVIKSSKSWKSRQCLAPCYSLLMTKNKLFMTKKTFYRQMNKNIDFKYFYMSYCWACL